MMSESKLEKPRWWVFTFGSGQEHAGYYVKIWGTFSSARNKMFEKYDKKWGFQYSWEEWETMLNHPYRYWPMEQLLEVIGHEEELLEVIGSECEEEE